MIIFTRKGDNSVSKSDRGHVDRAVAERGAKGFETIDAEILKTRVSVECEERKMQDGRGGERGMQEGVMKEIE